MDRATFPDYSDLEIKPRPDLPIPPAPESKPPQIVPPEPPQPAADASQRLARGKEGCTEADRLLGAIVNVARLDPPNFAAMRVLCSRFSREHRLDF